MKESALPAYPPMIVVFLGLLLASADWVLAKPWLVALLGFGGVAMVFLVVYLRRLRREPEEQAEAEKRRELIDRWSKRKDHR